MMPFIKSYLVYGVKRSHSHGVKVSPITFSNNSLNMRSPFPLLHIITIAVFFLGKMILPLLTQDI